jgi:hypothetical protein
MVPKQKPRRLIRPDPLNSFPIAAPNFRTDQPLSGPYAVSGKRDSNFPFKA